MNIGFSFDSLVREFLKHTSNQDNSHNVTAEQTGAYTKEEVDSKFDDLEFNEAATRAVGNGANELPDMSFFGFDLNTSSGYQELPSGLILQWVYVSGASTGDLSKTEVTFRKEFPSGAIAATALDAGSWDGGLYAYKTTSLTSKGGTFLKKRLHGSAPASVSFYVIAIGK